MHSDQSQTAGWPTQDPKSKRIGTRVLVAIIVATLVVEGWSLWDSHHTQEVAAAFTRVGGATRVETAVDASRFWITPPQCVVETPAGAWQRTMFKAAQYAMLHDAPLLFTSRNKGLNRLVTATVQRWNHAEPKNSNLPHVIRIGNHSDKGNCLYRVGVSGVSTLKTSNQLLRLPGLVAVQGKLAPAVVFAAPKGPHDPPDVAVGLALAAHLARAANTPTTKPEVTLVVVPRDLESDPPLEQQLRDQHALVQGGVVLGSTRIMSDDLRALLRQILTATNQQDFLGQIQNDLGLDASLLAGLLALIGAALTLLLVVREAPLIIQKIVEIARQSSIVTQLTVTGLADPSGVGSPRSVSVTAKDQFGNTVTGYTGTVHFTSTDGAATLPADYTFTTADAGSHTFSEGVTFGTAGSQTVFATDASNSPVTGRQTVSVHFVLFGLDPTTVYSGADFTVQMWTAGLSSAPTVRITPSGQSSPTTALQSQFDATTGKLTATVPSGTPAGTYDVNVNGPGARTEPLSGALTVTNTTTLSLTGISPTFAWNQAASDHTVSGSPFVTGARTYLVDQSSPSPAAIAEPCQFLRTGMLGIHVMSGLASGSYDLVVVNPDGSVGVLSGALTVTSAAPPAISAVTPLSIANTSGQNLAITGSNFRSAAVTVLDENGTEAPLTSGSCTASTCSVTVNASGLTVGDTLVLRVTNGDGSCSEYGPITVTNGSAARPAPVARSQLNTARRAPALAVARNASGGSFLYAIGGDNGTSAGALSSVEASAIDQFGNPGPSRTVNPLPSPKTLLGAVGIGQYVYAIGGSDGKPAVASGYRAQVLDPSNAPEISGCTLALAAGASHLGGGSWQYQVSAIFPTTDASNPGGESLGSFPVTVNVPATPGVTATLNWSAVPGANDYRVYRTATAGGTVPVLLATTTGTNYTDDGSATTEAQAALTVGALGKWAALPPMSSARAGAGAAVAYDPSNPSQAYIYMMFGLNAAGATLSNYEYLPVNINPDGSQAAGSWTTGTSTTSNPRWQLSAVSVTNAQASKVRAGTSYVYALSGTNAGGSTAYAVDAGQVGPGGDLGPLSSQPAPQAAGAGVAALNNRLYVFGGVNNAPSSSILQATIISPPTLRPWKNVGTSLPEPLSLPGSAANGGVRYLAGGTTGTGPTSTVEIIP
jgi:hypothetical protein